MSGGDPGVRQMWLIPTRQQSGVLNTYIDLSGMRLSLYLRMDTEPHVFYKNLDSMLNKHRSFLGSIVNMIRGTYMIT